MLFHLNGEYHKMNMKGVQQMVHHIQMEYESFYCEYQNKLNQMPAEEEEFPLVWVRVCGLQIHAELISQCHGM